MPSGADASTLTAGRAPNPNRCKSVGFCGTVSQSVVFDLWCKSKPAHPLETMRLRVKIAVRIAVSLSGKYLVFPTGKDQGKRRTVGQCESLR
jgi:hypothetical protein